MKTLTIYLSDGNQSFTSDQYFFQNPDKEGYVEVIDNSTQTHTAFYNATCSIETTADPVKLPVIDETPVTDPETPLQSSVPQTI